MCLGIPGVVQEITDREAFLAVVDISGVRRKVNVACVAAAEALDDLTGQWVLVHAGFAMAIIDEAEAEKTLELLQLLGEVNEEHLAMLNSAQPGPQPGQ